MGMQDMRIQVASTEKIVVRVPRSQLHSAVEMLSRQNEVHWIEPKPQYRLFPFFC